MTKERILELLKIEMECVNRNHLHEYNRDCANCDLVQNDVELLTMYSLVIGILEMR